MKAAARMERVGVPIDFPVLDRLRTHWDNIKSNLILRVDPAGEIYQPTANAVSFSAGRFARWLAQRRILWPRLASGGLALDDDTFKRMSSRYPDQVGPLRELRQALGQLRLNDLAVGADHRNRSLLSAFSSTTGRNQPSNSRFVFGLAAWLRSLIRPAPGRALAYVDWSQQEFGIAAALSGDINMQAAYQSGDLYMTFAKQAGAVPQNATKHTHPRERAMYKLCALGVQYGMGVESLAETLGEPPIVARLLLEKHRQTYPKYWRWSQGAVDHVMLYGWIESVFGWRRRIGPLPNPRSLANFPCQANGAEVLRLACCFLTEEGIAVCAPVHDALLVEGPLDEIDAIVERTQELMAKASRIVLGGFELASDANIVRYPDRYVDERGTQMWATVMSILDEIDPLNAPADG